MQRRFLFAVSMPIVLAIIVVAMIFISKPAAPTLNENFIFSLWPLSSCDMTRSSVACSPVCSTGSYQVKNNKVVFMPASSRAAFRIGKCQKVPPQLFIYVARENQIQPLLLKDVQRWQVNTNEQSPGGFQVINGMNANNIIPFSSQFHDSYYLMKDGYAKKIILPPNDQYAYNFVFLGWVKS